MALFCNVIILLIIHLAQETLYAHKQIQILCNNMSFLNL